MAGHALEMAIVYGAASSAPAAVAPANDARRARAGSQVQRPARSQASPSVPNATGITESPTTPWKKSMPLAAAAPQKSAELCSPCSVLTMAQRYTSIIR